jgi:hypothetical protein
MKSHAQALQAFARKMALLLMLRGAVRWMTVWFFVWGVVVLAARISGTLGLKPLLIGLAGAIPAALVAAAMERRKVAAFAQVRAAYDGLNQCGGVVMAEEAAEMSAWHANLPQPSSPALRWRSGRSVGFLGLSIVFAAVTLCLPDRFTALAATRPLEIGKLVGELRSEVQTLKEEKILEPTKAEELQKQLARLKEQSSAVDPNKTWEALDHIKEANSDLSRQAAEEAVSKTTSLSEAQTLAAALQQASESGMGEDTATRAAQDLASMLKAAKLEDGLINGSIPPELLSQLNGMNKEDLAKLLDAIQFNKSTLGKTVTNLANLKMIDAKFLSQCKNAGQCKTPGALSQFLSTCTNGSCSSFSELTYSYCRGGLSRGPGAAPMTWKDESSSDGAKFKEQALPPSNQTSESQFVGVSRTAPELTDGNTVAEHGALANADSSGGAAYSQVVLPRHKQTVQRFFKRDE